MNKRQDITNEELESFKDFDALLTKYHQTTITGSSSLIKWTSFVTIVVIGVVAFTYYFFEQKNIEPPKAEQAPVIQKDSNSKREEVKAEGSQLKLNEPAPKQKSSKETQPAETQQTEKQPVTDESESAQSQKLLPVYVQAEPVAGYANLYEYFNRELIYPQVAVKDSIQGVLTVSFIISKDGSVNNIQFTNSLGKPFEEEAIRLINNMPPWKPATVNGNSVPSKMSLPLTFQIQAFVEKK